MYKLCKHLVLRTKEAREMKCVPEQSTHDVQVKSVKLQAIMSLEENLEPHFLIFIVLPTTLRS